MDSRRMIIRPPKSSQLLKLKDHLLDDMSSCSSNGFKSFPRRTQCCTTVGFIHHPRPPQVVKPRSSKSVIQSVIAAVKRFQFEKKTAFLPRSFSKKILKKSSGFWKRRKSGAGEIQRLKSFDELLKEDSQPLDRPNNNYSNSNSVTSTSSESKSSSWSGSDFTVTDEAKNDVARVDVSPDSDAAINNATTNSSANNNKKQWSSEEKEQLSPVSVLDCPFDDEEDEVSSPFQHRLARMEGTKNKLMKKIQRFECLAQLEPMNLTKRFVAHHDYSDNESTESLLPFSSPSIDENFISDIDEEEDREEEENEERQVEEKALELLHEIKDTSPSYGLKLKADKLLLDFFREKIVGHNTYFEQKNGEEMLEEAEHWIEGRKPLEFLEWNVEKNREAYIRDMEKGKKWMRKTDEEHHREVALELETQIFGALLDDLLLDIIPPYNYVKA